MKALSISEVDNIVASMQAMVGARVQQAGVSDRDVGLLLYKARDLVWLHFDLNPHCPMALLTSANFFAHGQKTTPALLFLRSHFIGKKLQSVERDPKLGRLIRLEFSAEEELRLEVRLFPHGQNVILQAGDKSISLFKPKELNEESPGTATGELYPSRTIAQMESEWLKVRNQKSAKAESAPAGITREHRVLKLQKAIDQVAESLRVLEQNRYEKAGQALLETQDVEKVQVQFSPEIDLQLSLSENIQNCFAAHKKQLLKIAGARARVADLEKEKQILEAMSDEEFLQKAKDSAEAHRLRSPQKKLEKQEIKARKTTVGDKWEVWVGKSARDNLALLRKARAWDLWFHIKDEPGAHAILFRNKSELIDDGILIEAARFLLNTTLEKKKAAPGGGAYEFLVAEVRHVQPIKGDQLGRVTVRESRTLSVRNHSKNASR